MTDPFDPDTSPEREPETIISGRHGVWRKEFDIDDSLFSLKYVFRDSKGSEWVTAPADLTGTQSGKYWVFEATSAITTTWSPGSYSWDLVVVRNSDSSESCIQTGHIDVFSTTADRRSHATVMVEKIESILQGRADSDVDSYSIKSRSLTKMSVSELTKWRDYYRAEVGREISDSAGGGPKRNTLKVRFV